MNLFIIDAFTDRPFAGNPAAVCLLENERHDEWMQALAAETLPEENASTSILKKLDFRLVGTVEHPEDGTVWEWEWELAAGSSLSAAGPVVESRQDAP